MNDQGLNKGKMLRYFSMIRKSLANSGELYILGEDLIDKFVPDNYQLSCDSFYFKAHEKTISNLEPIDSLIERKLFTPAMSGWQWQVNKQKALESQVLREIKNEKPEDHLKRFTRSSKKRRDTKAEIREDEVPSPVSLDGQEEDDDVFRQKQKHHAFISLSRLRLAETVIPEQAAYKVL